MPKRRPALDNHDRVVRAPVRIVYLQTATANGVTVVGVDLSLAGLTSGSARFASLAAAFELWRVTAARCKIVPLSAGTLSYIASGATVGAAGVSCCVGYSPLGSNDLNTITLTTQIAQFDDFAIEPGYRNTVLTVSKKSLAMIPYKWLRTATRGSPAFDETCAGVFVTGVTLDGAITLDDFKYYVVVELDCEFRGEISSTIQVTTPAEVSLPARVLGKEDEKTDEVSVRSDAAVPLAFSSRGPVVPEMSGPVDRGSASFVVLRRPARPLG